MQHKKLKLNNNITNQRAKNQGKRPYLFIIYINEIVTQKKENYTAKIGILKNMQYIEPLLSSDCKQRLFLGNGLVNTFPLLSSRFLIMQQLDYNSENGVYLCRLC
jgi:hypothetical protein